jgi:hypothetical protein
LNALRNSGSSAEVSLQKDELIILNNALNEVLNGINVSEFQTRLGSSPDEARVLLAQIGKLLDKM